MILKFNKSNNNNRSIGQVYTPKYIAKFMVKNVINIVKNLNKTNSQLKHLQNFKVLEPSVGEGIYIKYLLRNNFSNIIAYEIDLNLKNILLKKYPNVKFKFENFLGSPVNEKFEIIIGNPPYLGQNYNSNIFQDYVENYPICEKFFVGNMDLFYYFIHLGVLKLEFGGILSFITTNYWITKSKKTGIKLLKPHVIDECYILQYTDLSNLKLFKGAKGQHNCIFVLQKKTIEEKLKNVNKNIEIIQIRRKKDSNQSDESFNEKILKDLIQNAYSKYILRYRSALTNKNLKREGSWNLLYPQEVHEMVEKIEKFCTKSGKISYLKDYFVIRNGLIFIKDDIFILNDETDLKVEKNNFLVKVKGEFIRLSNVEKGRLKKIYKSKSIQPYGYNEKDYIGYAIFFNKSEFNCKDKIKRNQLIANKYPVLAAYLKQFKKELQEILINAKENPNDFYFPRRGTFIRRFGKKTNDKLIYLEPFYDQGKKVFFKFISNKNIFGFSNTSYFATSDTYFLWPNCSIDNSDYLIILAYLNSKLVHFLFKAKNIRVKRSKTKLEDELPILNLNKFNSEKNFAILLLIKFLTSWLIEINRPINRIEIESTRKKLSGLSYFSNLNQDDLLCEIIVALENKDNNFIQSLIDKLFFQLLELKKEKIDYLLKKYY